MEIYVFLLDEGAEVWRPVSAEPSGDGLHRITGVVPDDEIWEFQPGDIVNCRQGRFGLIAFEKVPVVQSGVG